MVNCRFEDELFRPREDRCISPRHRGETPLWALVKVLSVKLMPVTQWAPTDVAGRMTV